FLTVTRLTIVKNVQTAIEAVRGLPGARLVVAGAGDERARLEAQAKGAPVTFVGPVDEAEKATLLRDCRAVVYIPMDEPFGLVALEGSLVGKPVVASNHGGLPEIVDHEKTGFLVPPGDVQAVRTAMGRLLQDGALAEGLGRAGQESVRHRYAPGAYVEKLEQVLAEVAAA
ncbi:MAG TPA: glycosyltransferase family 4 protein, partial [Candidatus Xenobia bacterium]